MLSPPCPKLLRSWQFFRPDVRRASQRPIGRADLSSCHGFYLGCTVLGSQPIGAQNPQAVCQQLCQPVHLAICTVVAQLRVIGLWVSSGDTLAPEYTNSLGEPPKGACVRSAVWALSHAVHRAHPRGSLLGHGEGGHARWPAKKRTNERWPRSLGVDWYHRRGGVERATLPRCPPAVHSGLLRRIRVVASAQVRQTFGPCPICLCRGGLDSRSN